MLATSTIMADIMRRQCEILVLLEHEVEELKRSPETGRPKWA